MASNADSGAAAPLRYVTDADAGYRRIRRGSGFSYVDAGGKAVRAPAVLARIRSLAIPPAWADVWICADPDGHLQAVGRDARGRKQYRYHREWRRRRDADKYERMVRLARRLPRIREAVEADLRRPGLPREKVLALVVRLLELTQLRVGNEAYARLDHTFGVTTMRDRHATVDGSGIRFRLRSKGGKRQSVGIRDRRLARLVTRLQDLPGQRLFEYQDEAGDRHGIESRDVNDYLRRISGADISAKDLRTWAASVLALRALRDADVTGQARQDRRREREAIEKVAARLGNTAPIAEASYVHPGLLVAWRDGAVARLRLGAGHDPAADGPPTAEEEAALLRLLKRSDQDRRQDVNGAAP
jgi:DNA topoisomerase-1